MTRTFHIGVQIDVSDPFWVLIREAVYQYGRQNGVDTFPLDIDNPTSLPVQEQMSLVEEMLASEVDGVICQDWPETLVRATLQLGIPLVQLTETEIQHPLMSSPKGLYNIARDLTVYLAEELKGQGRILVVGGLGSNQGEDGRSRLKAINDTLRDYPNLAVKHLISPWSAESGRQVVLNQDWQPGDHFDAIFGLSDSLALAARDASRERGIIDDRSLVVGINGDPLALAAIMEGSMKATVLTPVGEIAEQAVQMVCKAVQREPLPSFFSFNPVFVTARNVSKMAVQKLVTIADIPSRLIGDNRRQERQRLSQLETSFTINQQVGALLDPQRLMDEITGHLRVNYHWDLVRHYRWDAAAQELTAKNETGEIRVPLEEAGLLAEALRRNQPIFIPDTHHSHRFAPDAYCPEARSRIIVLIHLGDQIQGLLDLQNRTPRKHARQDLDGLQALADQIGVAVRNAELYSEAVAARNSAEKADQIKTRLLANVSNELRGPLNVILGFASAALATPNPYQMDLPPALMRDLSHIYDSGERLMRIINDLLDLSRAEIDELDLFPEAISPKPFLEEVFSSIRQELDSKPELAWRLDLPDRLPLLQADPVRLRQILLNLLNNAEKFTTQGEIVLGAEVDPPYLHLWIRDTGTGISPEIQKHIFEPFASTRQNRRRRAGVGLGLSITRQLVLLHGGTMRLNSVPGEGSTFHVSLPLPSLNGQSGSLPENASSVLAVLSGPSSDAQADLLNGFSSLLNGFSSLHPWRMVHFRTMEELAAQPGGTRPAALLWDLSAATAPDWNVIQALQGQPHLAGLPFILYGADAAILTNNHDALNGLLPRPGSQTSLIETINRMRPQNHSGLALAAAAEAQTREMLVHLVDRALPGFRVRTVSSQAALLERLAEEPPALILLHPDLPDGDGLRALERLRSKPAAQRTPVIVITDQPLNPEDVRRLNTALVTLQDLSLLTEEEAEEAVRRALDPDLALPLATSLAVKRAVLHLQQNFTENLSRQDLADAAGVSKNYLSNIFSQEMGLSPWDYLTRYRIKKAKDLLLTSHESIAGIACEVGFEDVSYFNRVFRKTTGCTPSAFREQGLVQEG
jgi:signal transduction histidine kinase/AraC-like DNA-binding protein/ABC-type sugar transport system substrate-binding protein